MAIILDLTSGGNTLQVSLYTDAEETTFGLLGLEEARVAEDTLRLFHDDAIAALGSCTKLQVSPDDWDHIQVNSHSLAGLLPISKRQKLSELARAHPRKFLILRLRNQSLAAMPWELLPTDNGKLLCETFNSGRQIIIPVAQAPAYRQLPSEGPIHILVIADEQLPNALSEGIQLYETLNTFNGRFTVEYRVNPTWKVLQRSLGRADIVHFAGDAHGAGYPHRRPGCRLREGEYIDSEIIEGE